MTLRWFGAGLVSWVIVLGWLVSPWLSLAAAIILTAMVCMAALEDDR